MNEKTYYSLKRLVEMLKKDVNWIGIPYKEERAKDLDIVEEWLDTVVELVDDGN